MHVILGAGGAVGMHLLRELVANGERVRLVGRRPAPAPSAAEAVAADLTQLEPTIAAVAGADVAYLLVGLRYDLATWRELWPRIMRNAIEACRRAGAKLIFFDNVYMYGRVAGPMAEETPFNPCSRKGEVRAAIATELLREMKSGALTAMIARAADFYGPGARTSVANLLVFEKFARGGTATWLVNDAVPHSFTYTPDAARALVRLAGQPAAWGQTWHLPTRPDPPTGRQFVAMAAREFRVPAKCAVLSRPLVRIAGFFDPAARESYEMLYQSDSPYVFDSSKFARAFAFEATTYAEGIRRTAATYR